MARVPNAVLLLPTVRYRGLELGDQAVIDDRRLVDAAVVAGCPCLHDRDALLCQFGRAGIAMGFDQRLQQYCALGADISACGALRGRHLGLECQQQACEEGGRRFPAHWLRDPWRHRLSSELTGQNETPWIRLRRLEAGLGALDTAVGDADTSRSSAWRYGLSEAKFRSGNVDRLVSMAVFKQTVDAGSFAAAARHFGIRPERAGHHARGGETHLGGRLWSGGRRR